MHWSSNKGYYILGLCLPDNVEIRIGQLGTFSFRPGAYFYVGRAKRNLRQRISRHFSKNKALRWHIDYFTLHSKPFIVLFYPTTRDLTECSLAKRLAENGGKPFPPRFGASDCRCPGHLIYYPKTNPFQNWFPCSNL